MKNYREQVETCSNCIHSNEHSGLMGSRLFCQNTKGVDGEEVSHSGVCDDYDKWGER